MAYLPRQLADLTGDFPVWNRARPGAERPEALSAEMWPAGKRLGRKIGVNLEKCCFDRDMMIWMEYFCGFLDWNIGESPLVSIAYVCKCFLADAGIENHPPNE